MTDTVLSMTDVGKSFRRNKVLENCTFDIERGSVTALVGSNGAGKSTLFSAMTFALFSSFRILERQQIVICGIVVLGTIVASIVVTPDLGGKSTTKGVTDATISAMAAAIKK